MLLVFGSINLDIAIRAARLPGPGETVLGGDALLSPGGKGANQAHAARRYGMPTRLVGAVGDDAFAAPAIAALEAAGVDLRSLQRVPGPTGCATICVDAAGENQIVVSSGANHQLRAEHVPDEVLAQSRAVLLQMETDPAQNAALLERAKAHGCLTVLNNAPAAPLGESVLRQVDMLVVNATELQATLETVGLATAVQADGLAALAARFALTAVLTRGARGVLACDPSGSFIDLPALPVDAVDTTGAGDTFCGVLAACLIEARPLPDALARASVAAALSCTRAGAQIAQPSRAEIEAALPRFPPAR